MPIRCKCSNCGASNNAPDNAAGKKIKCGKCGQVIAVALAPPADEVPVGVLLPEEPAAPPALAMPPPPAANWSPHVPPAPAPVPAPPRAVAPSPAPPPPPAAFVPPAAEVPLAAILEPDLPSSDPLPSTPEANFPAVNIAPSPSISSSTTKHAPTKKSNSPLPLLLAGGGGIAVILIGAAIFFAMNSSPGAAKKPGDQAKAGNNAAKNKSTNGTLVLDWPENERAGGRIAIGTERKTFPTTGPIEFQLRPGTHSITIQRRGFEPAHLDVTIVAGEEVHERPTWKELPQVALNPPPDNTGDEPEPFNTQPFSPNPPQPPTDDPFTPRQPNPQPAEPQPTPSPTPKGPAPAAAPEPYSVDREPGPVNQPALTISAEELTRRFAANEATALSMYGNDTFIQVDGIVESPFAPLGGDFGGGWIRLRGEGNMIVYCHVVQPWADFCKTLRPGHLLRIVGTKVGFHPDDKRVVVVQFCEFLSDDHRKSGQAPAAPGPAAPAPLSPEFDKESLKELSIYKGQKPQLKTTAAQITELFATKESVADETYGNDTMFEITGVITSINLPADENKYPSLTLKGHGVWQAELRFQHQWRDMLAQQKVGATVKLVAHHARKDFGADNQVWIDGAEFILE